MGLSRIRSKSVRNGGPVIAAAAAYAHHWPRSLTLLKRRPLLGSPLRLLRSIVVVVVAVETVSCLTMHALNDSLASGRLLVTRHVFVLIRETMPPPPPPPPPLLLLLRDITSLPVSETSSGGRVYGCTASARCHVTFAFKQATRRVEQTGLSHWV